jgi:DNA-directed RNA polymerase subunit RPC12/RpoP
MTQGTLELFYDETTKPKKRKRRGRGPKKEEPVAPTTIYRCHTCSNAVALHVRPISVECHKCRKPLYKDVTLDTKGYKAILAALNQ